MAATSAKRVGILVEFNYEDLEVGPRVPLAIDCMATVDAERRHRSLVTIYRRDRLRFTNYHDCENMYSSKKIIMHALNNDVQK